MIRVNLLKPRMSAVPDATKSGRKAKKRSAFISGYEAALGLLLLVGGATAMYFYFDGQVGDEESQPSPAGVATAPDDLSAEVAKEPGTAPGALDATSAGTPPADGTAEPTGDAVASEPVAAASPVKAPGRRCEATHLGDAPRGSSGDRPSRFDFGFFAIAVE